MKKILEKSGNFVRGKKWEPWWEQNITFPRTAVGKNNEDRCKFRLEIIEGVVFSLMVLSWLILIDCRSERC